MIHPSSRHDLIGHAQVMPEAPWLDIISWWGSQILSGRTWLPCRYVPLPSGFPFIPIINKDLFTFSDITSCDKVKSKSHMICLYPFFEWHFETFEITGSFATPHDSHLRVNPWEALHRLVSPRFVFVFERSFGEHSETSSRDRRRGKVLTSRIQLQLYGNHLHCIKIHKDKMDEIPHTTLYWELSRDLLQVLWSKARVAKERDLWKGVKVVIYLWRQVVIRTGVSNDFPVGCKKLSLILIPHIQLKTACRRYSWLMTERAHLHRRERVGKTMLQSLSVVDSSD